MSQHPPLGLRVALHMAGLGLTPPVPDQVFSVDPDTVRDLAPEVLDRDGRLRVLPAAFWAGTTRPERALLGMRHGIYSFPTTELVAHLREVIGERSAIEIGAGQGVLAEALGIRATDSRVQEEAGMIREITMKGGTPVRYGPGVERLHASQAVRKYKPDVVIACWVTQILRRSDPATDIGNARGVDEEDVLRHCGTYVLVGQEGVHADKRIFARPHSIEYPPFLVSRAMNEGRDFIATWRGLAGRTRPARPRRR